MPRYKYRCTQCEVSKAVFHLISETLSDCGECGGTETMEKLIEKKKIGEITKEHIEANREILEQQKQEAKEESHEPT
jgi:putative FmdB family regulatory protein